MLERDIISIGKSWIIVYSFYKYINPNENRWSFVSTSDYRISKYSKYNFEDIFGAIKEINVESCGQYNNDMDISKKDLSLMKKELLCFYEECYYSKRIRLHIKSNTIYFEECNDFIKMIRRIIKNFRKELGEKSAISIKFENFNKGSILLDIVIGVIANVAAEYVVREIDVIVKKIKEKCKKKGVETKDIDEKK